MSCAAAAAGLNVNLNKGVTGVLANTSLSTEITTPNSQKDEQMCRLVGEGGGYQQMENGGSSGSLVISDEDSCMLACLQQLQHLVPTVPPNTQLSQVQLLQHVIDYILDLELTLDYESLRPPSCNKHVVGLETVCERRQQTVWDPLEQAGCVEHLNEHGRVSREDMSGQNQTSETEEQCSTDRSNKTLDATFNSHTPSIVITNNNRSNV